MRILLVSSEYPPNSLGGIATYTKLMADLLAGSGHDVSVVTFDYSLPTGTALEGGVTVHRLRALDPGSRKNAWSCDDNLFINECRHARHPALVHSVMLADWLIGNNGQQYDIIHSQEYMGPMYVYLNRRLMKDLGHRDMPVAIYVHGTDYDVHYYNDWDVYHPQHRHLYHYADFSLSLCDGIATNSIMSQQGLVSRLGFHVDQIDVIRYPVGPLPDRPTPAVVGNEAVLFYAGRIEKRKGVDMLVRAVNRLNEHGHRVRVILAGGDTEDHIKHKAFRETIVASLTDEEKEVVRFLGQLQRDELWPYYAQATAVVMPSLHEPFGLVGLETMAVGGVLICSSRSGLAELLIDGENAIVCEPTVKALCNAINRAIALDADSAKRTALRVRARQTALEACDNAAVLQRTLDFFSRVGDRFQETRHDRRVPACLPFGDESWGKPHPRHAMRGNGDDPESGRRFNEKSTVAVVIPFYNLARTLPDTLQSVFAQTRTPDEVVTIDDGSTDKKAQEVAFRYNGYRGVKVIRVPNGGLSAARNYGASVTSSSYILFLDADDKIEPHFLADAAAVLDKLKEVGAVGSWLHRFEEREDYWMPFHPQLPYFLADAQLSPAALIRREMYDDVGGFKSCMTYGYEDLEFWLSCFEKNWPILNMPQIGHIYRIRKGSMLQSMNVVSHGVMRRALYELHKGLFSRFGGEALLILDQMKNGSHEYDALRREVLELRRRMEYIRSLPGRPLELLRFAITKACDRGRKQLARLGTATKRWMRIRRDPTPLPGWQNFRP